MTYDFFTMEDNSENSYALDDVKPGGLRRGVSRGFEAMTPMPDNFVPTEKTVLIGRGKKILAHPGTKLFKDIVATRLNEYLAAESRVDKTAILMSVIEEVRQNEPGGGFVKQNPKTGQYFEVGDFLAKEKTAQAFRDALHEYYSSSNPSKRKRRVESASTPPNHIKPVIKVAPLSLKLPEMPNMPGLTLKNEDENDIMSSSDFLDNNLFQMVHHSITSSRRSSSAPSSPTYGSPAKNLKDHQLDFERSATPPPSFSRFVSLDSGIQRAARKSSMKQQSFAAKRKRQSSVIFLGNTLAELTSTFCTDDATPGDDFEPIPLDKCDDFDLTKLI